jgi:hypothetical protein
MQMKIAYALLLLCAAALPLLGLWHSSAGRANMLSPPPLPAAVSAPDKGLLEKVLARNLWDEKREAIAPAETEHQDEHLAENQQWQLLAVSRVAGRGLVAVRHGDKIQQVKQGEALPGGEIMHKVIHNGVVYEKDGQFQRAYLFGKNSHNPHAPNNKPNRQPKTNRTTVTP